MSGYSRVSRDDYYMEICDTVAKRATCNRRHVGAIVVSNDRIVSTGYNGSLKGMPHCDEVGHFLIDGHCVRTIHAEMNAILEIRDKSDLIDAKMYINTMPCNKCILMILQSGIKNIIFKNEYGNCDNLIEFVRGLGVSVLLSSGKYTEIKV